MLSRGMVVLQVEKTKAQSDTLNQLLKKTKCTQHLCNCVHCIIGTFFSFKKKEYYIYLKKYIYLIYLYTTIIYLNTIVQSCHCTPELVVNVSYIKKS